MDEDFKDTVSPAEASQGYTDGSSSTFASDQRFLARWCVCACVVKKGGDRDWGGREVGVPGSDYFWCTQCYCVLTVQESRFCAFDLADNAPTGHLGVLVLGVDVPD